MAMHKELWMIVGVLAIVGGLAHGLQPLGLDLIGWVSLTFGVLVGKVLQLLAGISIIALGIHCLMKK